MSLSINDLTIDIISRIMAIDVEDFPNLFANLCKVLLDSVPGLILASILTYNKETQEIVYNSVECAHALQPQVRDLLAERIILTVDNSTSGRLVRSNQDILVSDDVLKETDYQSVSLAQSLGLKKAYFISLRDNKTSDPTGILILYPNNISPFCAMSENTLRIIKSTIESHISSAKRIREHNVLREVLDAAKKGLDLSSFLHRVVVILSRELSANGCSIFVVDPIDNLIKLKATLGVKPGPLLASTFPTFKKKDVYYRIGEGATGTIIAENITKVFHKTDISTSKWIERGMTTTFLGMPIPALDTMSRPIGVIRCSTRPNRILNSTIESFNHEDIELLGYISRLISAFIELSFLQEHQRQLITKMPHEVRAALGNIKSLCDTLKSEYGTLKDTGIYWRSFMSRINDIVGECDLSVMTVNSISALEDEFEAYDFEPVDLFTGIVAKVRKTLSPMAYTDKKLRIKYANTIGMPPIYLDKQRIQLVFHNLLVNAIKYSDKQRYDNPSKYIHIDALDDGSEYFTVCVSNFGIPIPYDRVDDIFINGIRMPEAIAKDPSGKGFGLALVKQIINMHEMSIKVSSLVNPTTFALMIPKYLTYKRPTKPGPREGEL